MPQTIISPATSDLIVKKSRFLGFVSPVTGRAEAQAVVARLRAEHPAAAHVCWALLAGGQSAAVDDGEPGGTAGRPMLDVLRHQDLEGVLAAVVRYYGGIKLGAGGLVRAYTDAVAQALMKVEKVAIVRHTEVHCTLPYSLEGMVRRELAAAGAILLEVSHGQRVSLAFRIAQAAAPALAAQLNEAASGQLAWQARHDES
ncbi:IMPACT family protein [Pseudoduganella sp. R-31]|uniref:IMPACT family protein n=1 Tax=Pseudoduganella sp. R-31 TaxID=3404060 RepID=UPI003CF6D3B5